MTKVEELREAATCKAPRPRFLNEIEPRVLQWIHLTSLWKCKMESAGRDRNYATWTASEQTDIPGVDPGSKRTPYSRPELGSQLQTR